MKEDIWRMDSTQSVEGLLIKVLRETKLTERFIDTSTRVKFYKFNNCDLYHNFCLRKHAPLSAGFSFIGTSAFQRKRTF